MWLDSAPRWFPNTGHLRVEVISRLWSREMKGSRISKLFTHTHTHIVNQGMKTRLSKNDLACSFKVQTVSPCSTTHHPLYNFPHTFPHTHSQSATSVRRISCLLCTSHHVTSFLLPLCVPFPLPVSQLNPLLQPFTLSIPLPDIFPIILLSPSLASFLLPFLLQLPLPLSLQISLLIPPPFPDLTPIHLKFPFAHIFLLKYSPAM